VKAHTRRWHRQTAPPDGQIAAVVTRIGGRFQTHEAVLFRTSPLAASAVAGSSLRTPPPLSANRQIRWEDWAEAGLERPISEMEESRRLGGKDRSTNNEGYEDRGNPLPQCHAGKAHRCYRLDYRQPEKVSTMTMEGRASSPSKSSAKGHRVEGFFIATFR